MISRLWLLAGLMACGSNVESPDVADSSSAAPAVPHSSSAVEQIERPGVLTGRVLETMDAGGYTYARIGGCGDEVWLAGPEAAIAVDDVVISPGGAISESFYSKTMDRTFDRLALVPSIRTAEELDCGASMASAPPEPAAHEPMASPRPGAVPTGDAGSPTIAEVYGHREEWAGRSVTIQGRVVKFSRQIMGTNWVHLQDGTGRSEDGTDDLTVRTDEVVTVGDSVVFIGKLASDKDFGAGYQYAAIVEEARLGAE